jgi:hypothetical protein
MPDNASAGDGLPSGSHPSAQSEAIARFQSYEEYLARLDRSPIPAPGVGYEEILWLASFTEDGRYIKRYTCNTRESSMPTNLSAVDLDVSGSDSTFLSPPSFANDGRERTLQDSHSSGKFFSPHPHDARRSRSWPRS